jgi:hypothetical protein
MGSYDLCLEAMVGCQWKRRQSSPVSFVLCDPRGDCQHHDMWVRLQYRSHQLDVGTMCEALGHRRHENPKILTHVHWKSLVSEQLLQRCGTRHSLSPIFPPFAIVTHKLQKFKFLFLRSYHRSRFRPFLV